MFGKSQPRATVNAARIIGPLLLAGGALLITQHHRVISALDSFLENDALLLIAGFIAILTGLVILVLHPHWRGVTQIIVSALGVWSLMRGALILLAPDIAREAAVFLIGAPQLLPILGCVMALLGLWLLVFSFIAPPEDGLGYFS